MSVVANYEEDGGLHALTEERPVSDWKRRLAKVHCTGWLVGWVRPASSSSLSRQLSLRSFGLMHLANKSKRADLLSNFPCRSCYPSLAWAAALLFLLPTALGRPTSRIRETNAH